MNDDGPTTVVASPRLPGLLDAAGWRALLAADVVVVRGGGGAWRRALEESGVPWQDAGRREPAPGETWLDLSGSAEQPGLHLLDLVAVMDRLRSPGGCPWDAEQTHVSLAPYALEEAFEVVDAVEHGTPADVQEELGDLLLQVVFHARVAQEAGPDAFDVDDVADGIVAKLVRRHPHVFAGGPGDAVTTADVEAGWEALKKAEKGRTSVLDGIPVALPALARAGKVLRRARREGLVDDPAEDGGAGRPTSAQRATGERLLALVAEATDAVPDLDVEGELRRAVHDLEVRVREREAGHPG